MAALIGGLFSANVSTNVSEQLNENITNIILKQAQDCSTKAGQTVDILAIGEGSAVDIAGDLNIAQSFSASVQCMSSTENQADLKQKIQAAAEQVAKNQLESASSFFNVNVSSNVSKITQIVETNFNFSDIQDCSTNIAQQARISAENGGRVSVGGTVNIKQQAQSVVECIKSSKMVMGISTEMANMISQEVENSSLSWFSYIIIFVIIVAIVGAGVAIYKYSQTNAQYADAYYADTQYADTQYADTQYADTQYVEPQYADAYYAEPQYYDETGAPVY